MAPVVLRYSREKLVKMTMKFSVFLSLGAYEWPLGRGGVGGIHRVHFRILKLVDGPEVLRYSGEKVLIITSKFSVFLSFEGYGWPFLAFFTL